MRTVRELWAAADREWRTVVLGAAAAVALVAGGLIAGAVEGGLLPGRCRGLACLFTTVVVVYSLAIASVWLVAALILAAARRRWPDVGWRVWVLRGLAVLSWLPVVGLGWLAAT